MAKSEAIEVEGVVLEKLRYVQGRNRRWTRNFSSHQWKA
jgi:hypothetical protein